MLRFICVCMAFLIGFTNICAQSNSILTTTKIAQYLPKETVFFGVASGERVLNKLGYKELVARFQSYYDMAANEIKAETGYNFLDPEVLQSLGLNVKQEVGFAFLDAQTEAFAFFCSISNQESIINLINYIGKDKGFQVNTETLGDATILFSENDPNTYFIFRGGYFFLLAGGSYRFSENNAGRTIVNNFAQLQLPQSLASDLTYIQSIQELRFGSDASGYVNISGILGSYLAEAERQSSEPYRSYLRDQIEYRKTEGATPEELAELESQAVADEQWYNDYRQREVQTARQVVQWFGSIKGIVMGGEVLERSIQMKCHVELEPNSWLARLFESCQGAGLFLQALNDKPHLMAYGKMVPSVIFDILSKIGGQDIQMLEQALKQEMQIDLNQDILAQIPGEMGFAFSGPVDWSNISGPPMSIDFFTAIRLTDGEKVRDLLNRLLSHPDIAPIIQRDEAGSVMIPIPEWKTVYLTIQNNNLICSSDQKFASRLSQGMGPSFVSQYPHPELQALLNAQNNAFCGVIDLGFFAGLGLSSSNYYSMAYVRNPDEFSTDEQKQIVAELNEISRQLDEIHKRQRQESMAMTLTLIEKVGITAMTMQSSPNRLRIQGGHFVSSNVPTWIGNFIEQFIKIDECDNRHYQEREPLETKRWQLEDKLYQQPEMVEGPIEEGTVIEEGTEEDGSEESKEE